MNRLDLPEGNGGRALAFDQLLITQAGMASRVRLGLDRNGVADGIRIDLLDTSATAVTIGTFIL